MIIKYIFRFGIAIILIGVAIWGNTWIFNHLNPWLSLLTTLICVLVALGIIITTILKIIKQQ